MKQQLTIGRVFRALVPLRPRRSLGRGHTRSDTGGRQAVKIRIPVTATGDGRRTSPVLVPVRVCRNR
jgi:hypothetical protein